MDTFWIYLGLITLVFLWDTIVKISYRLSVNDFDKKLKQFNKLQSHTDLKSQLKYLNLQHELNQNQGINMFGLLMLCIFAYFLEFNIFKFTYVQGIVVITMGTLAYYFASKINMLLEWVYMILFLTLFYFIFHNKIVLDGIVFNFIIIIVITIVFYYILGSIRKRYINQIMEEFQRWNQKK